MQEFDDGGYKIDVTDVLTSDGIPMAEYKKSRAYRASTANEVF